MKTYPRTLGVLVILSFVFLGSSAFCDEQAMGKAEMMYASVIDKEIGKDQAKIELKNSGSANLPQEAVETSMMLAFLKDYKKELIAEMKRKDIGTTDYQINNFLNEKFLEVYSSAWLLYCCDPRDNKKFLEVYSSAWSLYCCAPRDPE
jgi:hypothetical protein